MKRIITILGTLLTVIVLMSGSAVAQPTWHYAVDVADSEDCTNPDWALGAPNPYDAALGTNGLDPKLGWMLLDLGSGNEMGASQDFTVYASSSVLEYYRLYIWTGEAKDPLYPEDGWLRDDTQDYGFTTPSTPGMEWRYFHFVGISGICDPGDPYYGADIDAVGWYG
ncbi:MAG: hypothetical protein JSW00_12190 [Thermoplasmata archaeon]|nr:MAG: hypothetical protein JSW00_12190 [Thermoplasmata archaeon]